MEQLEINYMRERALEAAIMYHQNREGTPAVVLETADEFYRYLAEDAN